jgi:hypothetical protein
VSASLDSGGVVFAPSVAPMLAVTAELAAVVGLAAVEGFVVFMTVSF